MLSNGERSVSFVAEGVRLSGILHLPKHAPLAVVVGCHGLMADKRSPKQIALARGCAEIDMAYLRFDHRGCGSSEGVFETDTTLENRMSDLMAAVRLAKQTFGQAMPIGLFGSSLGGTVCLSAARSLSPFAIVTLAAPVQSRSIQLPTNSPQSLINELVTNRLTFNVADTIRYIHHVLIIHGSNDETVALENAYRIYDLARDPKELLILKQADHRISEKTHQESVLRKSVKWFLNGYNDQFPVSSSQK